MREVKNGKYRKIEGKNNVNLVNRERFGYFFEQ